LNKLIKVTCFSYTLGFVWDAGQLKSKLLATA
jgi:hypothetical protein